MCAVLKKSVDLSPTFSMYNQIWRDEMKSEDGDITPTTSTEVNDTTWGDLKLTMSSECRDIPLKSFNINRRRESSCLDVVEIKRMRTNSHCTLDLTDDNKENFDFRRNKLSVPCDMPRMVEVSEADNHVFKFSIDESSPKERRSSISRSPSLRSTSMSRSPSRRGTSMSRSPAINIPVLRLASVSDSDSVFLSPAGTPQSCLLLTPSTTYSPRPSSCTSIQLDYSPDIHLGISCNTPSRMKIEMEGLGSDKLVLGRGAYGTVVLGQWRGQKVAVKVMEKEEGVAPSSRRRKSVESELQALKLEHENIVKLHGVFAAQDRYSVIIMEYVGSRNLHRLLIETPEKVIGKTWLLGASRQISSALSHCHSQGVLHLDVKPANILVTSNGVCKLGDFGCSVGVNSGDLPLDHSLVGTPGYQAPEFLRGYPPTPACDIYSLGILYWQLDSRLVPFQGMPAHTIMFCTGNGMRPKDPLVQIIGVKEFTVLYRNCWSTDPSKRPAAPSVYRKLCQIISTQSINFLSANMSKLRF